MQRGPFSTGPPTGRSYAPPMARYFDVHPRDPQPRSMTQIVGLLREDALIAYPTDSCYALGCKVDSPTGGERIRADPVAGRQTPLHARVRRLRSARPIRPARQRCVPRHQSGDSRPIHVAATKEVPRRLAHAKKRTVGMRIPDHPVVRALLRQLGEPLLSSTLLMPGAHRSR